MKIAKVYEGWKKTNPGSDKYKTIGTEYYAGYKDREAFDEIVNSGIAAKYDESKIEIKVINGDGGAWIGTECKEDMGCIYQLDLFHIYSKASKKVNDKNQRQILYKLIKENKWEELIDESKKLWENAEEEEKDSLWEVYRYYKDNQEALKRYQERISPSILKNVKGTELRGMGTMESSVHNVLADRMKRVAWSEEGANAVAKSLCLIHSEGGDQELQTIIYSNKFGLYAIDDVSEVISNKMNELKKNMSSAIRDVMRQNKKKRKFGCMQDHNIKAFDGQVTGLTKALRGLINHQTA